MTAFRVARSVTPVSGGVERPHGADLRRDERHAAGPRPTSRRCYDAARSSLDEKAGDKPGPISIAAAVSAPVGDASRTPSRRPTPRADAPKPETRVVVFGDSDFAANARARHPGQPRPVHEHGRLAVAAGEPDLDPAEGSRRPPAHADGDAAEQHHLALAADRSGGDLRHRASTPGGGGGRCADCDPRSRCSSSSSGSARTSTSSRGSSRRRYRGVRREEGLRRLEADKIEEMKIKAESGRRARPLQEGRRARGRSSRRSTPEPPSPTSSRHHHRARPDLDDRRASSTRTRPTSTDYGLDDAARRGRVQGRRRQAGRQAAHRRQDADRRQPLRQAQRREARVPDRRVPERLAQQVDLRPARQGGHQVRARQGRRRRRRRRRQDASRSPRTASDWKIDQAARRTRPIPARSKALVGRVQTSR